jgi:tRNA dimethylallyltransferase
MRNAEVVVRPAFRPLMNSAFKIPHSTFFLVGPTAVGKSDIAVELAERLGAEILNADAFQLYAGLDLLTAKPAADALRRVRHHLIGSFALSESMSVARYLEAARGAVAEIQSRGRPVVVVGGTGLYVRALTHGLSPGPASDLGLRDELAALPPAEALERLQRIDPAAFDRVDRRNPRRVQRALEIAVLRGTHPAAEHEATPLLPGIVPLPITRPIGFFLQRERADLHHRIMSRTDEMFRRGVLAEVAAVDPAEVGSTAAQMIGWRECLAGGRGELTDSEARHRIDAATRQYAKRQITWFKREVAFRPLSISPGDSPGEIAARITEADFAALATT